MFCLGGLARGVFVWGFLSGGLCLGGFVLGFLSGGFCLGYFCPDTMKSTKTATRQKCNSIDVLSHAPAISQKNQEPKTITHNDEKIALVLALAGGSAIWNIFN